MAKYPKKYWLAESPEEVVRKLCSFHGAWSIWGSNPIMQAWVRNSMAYYSAVLQPNAWDSSLVFDGEQGELVQMIVPQARKLIRQLTSLLTKQKLSFTALLAKRDTDVMQNGMIANALLEQLAEDEKIDLKHEILVERALVFGISFVKACWRTDLGEPRLSEDNKILFPGWVDITTPSVFDVFYDYQIENWEDLDWVEVRHKRNRYDLIAQFPELEEELLAVPSVRDWDGPHYSEYVSVCEEDNIYVYELFHKTTPALASGRMLMYASENAIFFDDHNKYERIPVEPVKPEPIFGMGLGYPLFSDLLPSQEMLDHSFSAVATNQSAFAVQNVTVPRGSGVTVEQIAGMNFISYTPMEGGGKPEPLQLSKTSPDTWRFMEILKGSMEELSSINPALRGSPPPGVTSGVAIATLSVNALEFIDSLAKNVNIALERTMYNALSAIKIFGHGQEFDLRQKDQSGGYFHKSFRGRDLQSLEGISIQLANPILKTMTGRTQLADKLTQSGLVKDVQSYISVLDGAPLNTLHKTESSENELIESENERLRRGTSVPILATDDHARHIREQIAILNDPMVRENEKITKVVLEHVMEHRQLAEQTDPMLLAMARTGMMPQQAPAETLPPEGGSLPPSGGEEPTALAPRLQPAEPAEDLIGQLAGF